ncbi:DUF3048 domain-containing protein [Candidatus Parcubacteria bacterium]|nr:MAG: DUF3048 domain-containing protein [Candidatus Parcubacteria bacterium]
MLQLQPMKRLFLLPAVVLCAAGFLVLAKPAAALDRALVYGPKADANILDQPLKIAGIIPVNSRVFFVLNGRVIGSAGAQKTKNKKATTSAFSFTYKKTLKAGTYALETQVYKSGEWSDKTSQSITVPAKWQRKIDGMQVKTSEWNKLPIGIMIENTPDARPQAGLGQASVVYETLAEGGVTRFLAIFPQATKPKLVGPVRSSRPYYVDWAKEYDAIYLHAGGSRDALNEIGKLKVRSFDALTKRAYSFTFRKCVGVHCLFTDKARLQGLVNKYKLTTQNAISQGWIFKNDVPLKNRPKHSKKITIDFNGRTYRVDWQYDRKTNRYKRWNGGVIAKDRNTGKQLTAANIVVMRVPKEKVLDRKLRISLKLTGKGSATLYRDGNAINVQWRKASASARTKFYSKATGKEIEFNRGQTWIEVVPGTRKVTYR